MKLDFVKLSPTQNMTLLVTGSVDRAQHSAVAARLMGPEGVGAEQVGFLEPASDAEARMRLQMMGGEFCGNAAMSLAAFLAFQDQLPDSAECVYPLEVSGADDLVRCRIRRRGDEYLGSVCMPLPTQIQIVAFPGAFCCPVVFFPGIAHAILPEDALTCSQAEACIADWCAFTDQEAFGIILRGEDAIRPLVYVRETGSAVWERGCGSGSAAVGAYTAAQRAQNTALDLRQPGGLIRVNVDYDDSVRRIEISGTVKIVAMGQAWV